MHDNLQLSGVCVFVRAGWWTVSVPEPEYSVQGYASATVSHAAAHKARYLMPRINWRLFRNIKYLA